MIRKIKDFLSSFVLTLTVVSCFAFGFLGVAKAYENTVYTAFGTQKSAIALTDDGIRILDIKIKLKLKNGLDFC